MIGDESGGTWFEDMMKCHELEFRERTSVWGGRHSTKSGCNEALLMTPYNDRL